MLDYYLTTPSISYLMSFRPNELAYQQYKFVVGNNNQYRTEGVTISAVGGHALSLSVRP
jgi:hypothetical protein